MSTMVRLFHARSVIDDYHDRDHVTFHWWVSRQWPVEPYPRLVKNYRALTKDDRFLAEEAVKEMLTREEVRQLSAYLWDRHRTTLEMEEEPLPLARVYMPWGGIPVGGGCDNYMLSHEAGYSLPFTVWAYYDLEGCPLTAAAAARPATCSRCGTVSTAATARDEWGYAPETGQLACPACGPIIILC